MLAWWVKNKRRLRPRLEDAPSLKPNIRATQEALRMGEVVCHTAWGGETRVLVEDLLDDNVVFARLAGFQRGYEVRPQGEWEPWDRILAWSEQPGDAPAGVFDLPAAYRRLDNASMPLLGWRLDVIAGIETVMGHGQTVRFRHPRWPEPIRLRLSEAASAIPASHDVLERLGSRPLYAGPGWGLARLDHIDPLTRQVHLDTVPAFKGQQSARVQLELDTFLAHNGELAGPVRAWVLAQLDEVRRRMEAHASAGGQWVLPPQVREKVGLHTLPLTGWRLSTRAFAQVGTGQVHLVHELQPQGIQLGLPDALAAQKREVPAGQRLMDDPSWVADGELGFLRAARPTGLLFTPRPGQTLHEGGEVGYAEWLSRNPTLAPLLLQWKPRLGVEVTSPELFEGLRALREAGQLPPMSRLDSVLTTPLPDLQADGAIERLAELFVHPELLPPISWTGPHGATWRWIGVTPEGMFRVAVDDLVATHRALPGEAADGTPISQDRSRLTVLELTPWQLAFAHPPLARTLAEWQIHTGLLDASGEPVGRAERLSMMLDRATGELQTRIRSASEHLRVSEHLGEAQSRRAALTLRMQRMRANLQELEAGRGVHVFLDDSELARLGVGLAVGGVHGAVWRAGDDRIRVTSAISSHFMGRYRLIQLGGGDSFSDKPSGPRISALLERIENTVAKALVDVVNVDEAFERALDAIATAGDEGGSDTPYCSHVALLTHLDSGASTLYWSGNSGAWLSLNDKLALRPLTHDHTIDGLVALAHQAGLDQPDAVAFALSLIARRVRRKDLEELDEDLLLRAAQKYADTGRRKAIRAALGGNRERMVEEHERLAALLASYREAYGARRVACDPVEQGKAMIFRRRLQLVRDSRIVLATDGLRVQLDGDPLYVCRALSQPEPQRAAEWLADSPGEQEGATDDLAVVVVDLPREQRGPGSRTRRKNAIYRLTEDQTHLHEGGIVPGIAGAVALRINPRQLGRFHGEINDMIRLHKAPAPESDPRGFVQAVCAWAFKRKPMKKSAVRDGERVRDLHLVFQEPNESVQDETLMVFCMLRRFGVRCRYVSGLRLRGETSQVPSAACWLEFRDAKGWHIVDLGLSRKAVMVPRDKAYVRGAQAGGALAGRTSWHRWLPDPVTWVEIATGECPPSDPDPWLRLQSLGHPVTPTQPVSRPRATPHETVTPSASRAPVTEAPPEEKAPAQSGWLELDF